LGERFLVKGFTLPQAPSHQGISSLGFLRLWVQIGYSLVVDEAVKRGFIEIGGIGRLCFFGEKAKLFEHLYQNIAICGFAARYVRERLSSLSN